MSKELAVFNFENNPVRTLVDDNNEILFAAPDVAKNLGYRDAANMCRMLDDDEQGYSKVSTLGGEQEISVITESGLYMCVFRSRKPEAKTFRRWVTQELLPQIRKTGKYAPTQEQLLLEHINTAVAGLKAMHNMSYKDKLTAARECLKEGIDITDDVPNKLVDDLKYFTLRELTKRSAYIKESYLREALCDGGLLQKNGELTETGRYYGRYNSWGMPTFRLEALEYTLDTSTLRCWNR